MSTPTRSSIYDPHEDACGNCAECQRGHFDACAEIDRSEPVCRFEATGYEENYRYAAEADERAEVAAMTPDYPY